MLWHEDEKLWQESETMYDQELKDGIVCGLQVQYDHSGGQGHCWRNVDLSDHPDIADEISAEMIDGGKWECDDYVATNGCHYRWA